MMLSPSRAHMSKGAFWAVARLMWGVVKRVDIMLPSFLAAYELPYGNVITVGVKRLRCAEVLLQPETDVFLRQ